MFPLTYTSNIVVDLFPTTTKTRKYQNTLGRVRNCKKHQSERVVACGDGMSTVTKQVKKYRNRLKIRDFERFAAFGSLLESLFRVLTIAS